MSSRRSANSKHLVLIVLFIAVLAYLLFRTFTTRNDNYLTLVIYANKSAYIGYYDKDTKKIYDLDNKTGFNKGNEPLRLCALYDLPLPDGRPLASCVTRFEENKRRNFPIDPITKSLLPEYKGDLPKDAVLHDVLDINKPSEKLLQENNIPFYGMYTEIPDHGILYFMGDDTRKLRLSDDKLKSNTVIATGDFKFVITYPISK